MKKEILIVGGVIAIVLTIAICTNEITKNQNKIILNQNAILNRKPQQNTRPEIVEQKREPKFYRGTNLGYKPTSIKS